MWIFTTLGFFSVVADRRTPDMLVVRGRDRADLERLALEVPALKDNAARTVVETPRADYPFRIALNRDDFTSWLTLHAEEIEYDNFKGAVARSDARRATLYHEVWDVMRKLDPREAPRRRSK